MILSHRSDTRPDRALSASQGPLGAPSCAGRWHGARNPCRKLLFTSGPPTLPMGACWVVMT